MNINEVIKYPILSEKTYSQMEKNIFTFAVDFRTNKTEVKKTIEFIFGVKVAKVNIFNVQKKPTKLGRFHGFTKRHKKAIITLLEGTINLFPEEVTAKSKTTTKTTKTTKLNKEPSEAEKKAAEKIAAKAKEAEVKKESIKIDAKKSSKKADK
ncbi:MAG: 50S ribosomal protein L23 [Mycoplasma sp.]|nr:50S ribosomal protein L23 [Mycoplasma sp.]